MRQSSQRRSIAISHETAKKIKEKLVEVAEKLYQAGFNVLPAWAWKRPAFLKEEHYQQWLTMRMTRDEFEEITLARIRSMEKPWDKVLGIAVVCGVSGLVAVDYDVAKLGQPDIEARIAKVIDEFGSFVYIERRIGLDGTKYGLHVVVRFPVGVSPRVDPKLPYQAEFSARDYGLLYTAPSVMIIDGKKTVYKRLSFVPLYQTYYDYDCSVLKQIVGILGGELRLAKKTEKSTGSGGKSGVPKLGLKLGKAIKDPDLALRVLKAIAVRLDCEGFAALIDLVSRGYWPVPYEILHQRFGSSLWNHYRSTWTIVENHIFRTLAEIGVPKEVAEEIKNRIKKMEIELMNSSAFAIERDADNIDKNFEAAYEFKEHGHDTKGACIYKLLGICSRTDCPNTFLGLLFSNPEAVKKAIIEVLNSA